MATRSNLAPKLAQTLLALAGALVLTACGGASDEDANYETDVVDESGGELVVTEASDAPVEDVDIPDTPMTPVARGADGGATPAVTPTPE